MRRLAGEMQALSRSLIEKREKERQNIAHELHEEIAQILAVIKLLMDKAAISSPEKAGPLLDDARVKFKDLFDHVREFSYDLYPRMLETLGLLHSLLWYFDRYSRKTKIRVHLRHTGLKRGFDLETGTAAFRIIEEALTNVACHAAVDEAKVSVRVTQRKLRIRVEDKGKGFNPPVLSAAASTGLLEMRERTLMLGGKLVIQSAPGMGTLIAVEIPLASAEKRAAGKKE